MADSFNIFGTLCKMTQAGQASENRRPAPKDSDAFAKTMQEVGESVELAMANRLVQSSIQMDSGEDKADQGFDGLGMGLLPGMPGTIPSSGHAMSQGFDPLQMNMFLTMASMDNGGLANALQPPLATPLRPPYMETAVPETDAGGAAARTAQADAADSSKGGQNIIEILGELARRFESGPDGVSAVGFDRNGGTSYGTFQLSSRQGSMEAFLDFAAEAAPEIAERLRGAGPANTGGRSGAMPRIWKQIAQESPVLLESLERQFVTSTHYQPALASILKTIGIAEADLPPAVREVIFSTAVQHGPSGAAGIFSRAVKALGGSDMLQAMAGTGGFDKLIDQVYDVRATRFGNSSRAVRRAVQHRLADEKELALAMLDSEKDQA